MKPDRAPVSQLFLNLSIFLNLRSQVKENLKLRMIVKPEPDHVLEHADIKT